MRVGFEAKRLFHNQTGLGNYCRNLVSGLLHHVPGVEPVLYSPKATRSEYYAEYSRHATVRSRSGWRSAWWRSISQAKDWKGDNLDLYHGLAHEVPLRSAQVDIPVIVTVHDLVHLRIPEDHSWLDRKTYHWKLQQALKRAQKVVCISEATQRDVWQYFPQTQHKTVVVYQSFGEQFLKPVQKEKTLIIQEKYGLPQDYVMFLGGTRPRKNLSTLLKAWRIAKETLDVPLVLVGPREAYQKVLTTFGYDQGAIFLVEAEWSDLPYVYDGAGLFVYPSYYEGFGIPILEAFARDTAVITSKVSSMPEVAGEAARLVEPMDADSLAYAIVKILEDESLRRTMIERGRQQKEKFTLEKFATKTYEVYQSVIQDYKQ